MVTNDEAETFAAIDLVSMPLVPAMKILIVGFSEPGHMGDYLASAAKKLGLQYKIMDAGEAEASSRIGRSLYWRLMGKRPARLADFGKRVVDMCALTRPNLVLTTGRAPLDRSHIENLHSLGIKVINYSTDDPWNPTLRAAWFISTLPYYDAIFTPRRANFEDFRSCGVRVIHDMPFAYDPGVHRPWPENAVPGVPSDVLFVGGCDSERLPLVGGLIEAGLNVALFGAYWNRHSRTRAYWRGIVDQDTIRAASATTKVCLCLVRRANRDGHVMRSFEAAAIGGCILAEDTTDHREIFGPDDGCVRYFKTVSEMVRQAKFLVTYPETRFRLLSKLRERVAASKDTYADRLSEMLRLSNMESGIASNKERTEVRIGDGP
jgi:spore maturation protein CgeB